MKLTKMIMVVLTAMLIAVPAFAGTCPEYDAVGCDADNYFADYISGLLEMVCENNIGIPALYAINEYSAFPFNDDENWGEKFCQDAGMEMPDPCFPGYMSALAPAWCGGATFKWWIILQMQPESDINVNIYDCVLKHNESDIWTQAQQTGRYLVWGQPIFDPTANPTITVKAINGPYNSFTTFFMDGRKLPGLDTVAMKDKLYTSKALFDESIVLVKPRTGDVNKSGQMMKTLKQGDMIKVRIKIPVTNPCDIRYGQGSVILKYIGVVGNYMLDAYCGTCG